MTDLAFSPARGLANPHLQTIVASLWPRGRLGLAPESETVVVDEADGSRVLCHCHWQERRTERTTVVLVHGLEGSSDAPYVRGLTARAWAAGFNVVRMNVRNCGGTEELTPTLYHSGLSGDVGAVVRHMKSRHALTDIALVGYSMGGNMVLKLAGEWGTKEKLVAVVAVSPAADLALTSDALLLSQNRIYQVHFLRTLLARYRRKAAMFPKIYDTTSPDGVRSVRDFDHSVIARYFGFTGADDYYHRAAAARVLHQIGAPTLIVHATDDPFIRFSEETMAIIRDNARIAFLETRHGGHCGFLGRGAGQEAHWAEAVAIRHVQEHASVT